MRAMALKSLMAAGLLSIGPALAMHLMQVISVAEFVERRLSQPEDDFSIFRLNDESQKHIQYWRNRLTDRSLQVVGPCRLSEDDPHECRVAPYPLFPLPDSHRNALLQRPDPDIVLANIKQVTDGELSTVDELVEKVNANLENLNVLSDDEMTLLATNFAEPKAGLTINVGCGPINYIINGTGWPEDQLVSQDEQRALLAGFLYVLGDFGYLMRRDEELKQYIHDHSKPRKKQVQECEASVSGGTGKFRERVEQLDREVIISETEWLARYEEYLAAQRAELYGMVPGGAAEWDRMRSKIENIISIAEDMVEKTINGNIPTAEPGFIRFLDEKGDEIRHEFPGLRPGIVRRLAYRRWKTLSPEKQSAYLVETES
ncbi:hypothetical protein GGS26DRAFT_558521 [Hypomontagnella submonticulosa]|nr:hypothetical protein GGS26DRAFT_558521 [Hypomontagnella submonticulosa]